jgi:hypothetical protein
MSRPRRKFVWTFFALFCSVLPAGAQAPRSDLATCDAGTLDGLSYGLTTRAQAQILTGDESAWYDSLVLGGAAEHALKLDSRNLLAHGILARQYVVAGEDATYADRSWRTVLDNGGAVTWTATLHDVDYKSYFVVAFTRESLRIYRYGELAGPFEEAMGMPKFVGPERERFYRALGGCIDPGAKPEVDIPWSKVREIRAGNWVLWFKLTDKVTIVSDNGERRTDDEIKVNLHGASGHVEVLTSRDSRGVVSVRPMGIGPLDFQQRVRYTLVKHVDPDGHIQLPHASRSAGW